MTSQRHRTISRIRNMPCFCPHLAKQAEFLVPDESSRSIWSRQHQLMSSPELEAHFQHFQASIEGFCDGAFKLMDLPR